MEKFRTRHREALKNLEAEMKLLQWHKLANETALQTALMRTKAIRQEEAKIRPRLEEARRLKRRERLKKAIEDEESQPLQVCLSLNFTRTIKCSMSAVSISNDSRQKLSFDAKSKLNQEEQKLATTEKKQEELRTNLLLESKKMVEERGKLKSRKEYCRTLRSAMSGEGKMDEIITFESFKSRGFSFASSDMVTNAVMKELD